MNQNVTSLALGAVPSAEALQEIKAALKPGWEELGEADKEKAKLLAVGAVLGNPEAIEEFRKAFLIWFPVPLPPFPPIIWQIQAAPITTSSVAIGLIVIGIGIRLL